jgi:hypothetical protein
MLKRFLRGLGIPEVPAPRREQGGNRPSADRGDDRGTRSSRTQPPEAASEPTPAPSVGDVLPKASHRGESTGFEPRILVRYQAPISINAKGSAGLGLFASGFSGQNVYSGQMGEVGFYKALCMDDLIDHASSYWSVAMPASGTVLHRDPRFDTDIDCVIVQGGTMHLLDLKYYASGDVTWHSTDGTSLLCRDNATGQQVGNPRSMSRNMAMASARFSRLFPRFDVCASVVLIPTDSGIGKVAPGTAWPGDVPLRTLPEMLAILRSAPAGYADTATDHALSTLLKR